jgi:hypothetical protein
MEGCTIARVFVVVPMPTGWSLSPLLPLSPLKTSRPLASGVLAFSVHLFPASFTKIMPMKTVAPQRIKPKHYAPIPSPRSRRHVRICAGTALKYYN